MKQHSSKSFSFLLELLLVIFFFAIAASICVLVMSNAKEKDVYANDVKQAHVLVESLLDEGGDALYLDQFALNKQGELVHDGIYQVRIEVIEEGSYGDECRMEVMAHGKQVAQLHFYRGDNR